MTKELLNDLICYSKRFRGEFGPAGSIAETRIGLLRREFVAVYPDTVEESLMLHEVYKIPGWRGGANLISHGSDADAWVKFAPETPFVEKLSFGRYYKDTTGMPKIDLKNYSRYYPEIEDLSKGGVMRFKNGEVFHHYAPWQTLW